MEKSGWITLQILQTAKSMDLMLVTGSWRNTISSSLSWSTEEPFQNYDRNRKKINDLDEFYFGQID